MGQQEYNAHYDATAAKGLCWEGDGNPQLVQTIILPTGEQVDVRSLWCLECKIADGEIQDFDGKHDGGGE